MTDREDEMLDLYKTHAYLPHDAENNPLTPFGNFAKGYELAWQARGELDAVRIKELESDLDDRKREINLRCGQIQERDTQIAELTAKLDKAREALKWIDKVNAMDYEYVRVARQALEELDK